MNEQVDMSLVVGILITMVFSAFFSGMEIGKMEALGEETGWRDKGQGTSDGIAWNGGERGKRGI